MGSFRGLWVSIVLKIIFIGSVFGQNGGLGGPDELLLKHYEPKSIYNIRATEITRAKFPIIDMHSHDYTSTHDEIEEWVKTMDQFGIEKTVILSYKTGAAFDSVVKKYAPFGDRFEIWCGFDYTGYEKEGWSEKAVKELERCYKAGARGVGELGDKGNGLLYSKPTPAYGMHIDDLRMKPLLEKCAVLNMPVNIHVAEPKWMYEKMDQQNDGLMNAFKWKIDVGNPETLSHGELIETLKNAVEKNPKTTFIACHFANCSYDLSILSQLLEKYPNLYADISARYAETATIPRYMRNFYTRHQDKLIYGTDMGTDAQMYETTLRILETEDEHFYLPYRSYHWPSHGFNLPDEVLKKVYKENALKLKSR